MCVNVVAIRFKTAVDSMNTYITLIIIDHIVHIINHIIDQIFGKLNLKKEEATETTFIEFRS